MISKIAVYILLFLSCSVHAEQSIDEMKSAIQSDSQLADLARQLIMAKQAFEHAKTDYKNFRVAFGVQKLSLETAGLAVDADKAAGIDDAASFAAAKAQVDASKQDAAATASKVYKDVAERRRALEGNVTAWKNKLLAAQRLREQGERELADATQPAKQSKTIDANDVNRRNDGWNHRTDVATATTGAGSIAFNNNDAVASAQHKIETGRKDEMAAQQELNKAQQALAAIAGDVVNAEAAKKTADASAPVAPKAKKVVGYYLLNNGTTLEALSVMEAGDDYVIRTDSGMQTVKKTDVKDIRLQQP